MAGNTRARKGGLIEGGRLEEEMPSSPPPVSVSKPVPRAKHKPIPIPPVPPLTDVPEFALLVAKQTKLANELSEIRNRQTEIATQLSNEFDSFQNRQSDVHASPRSELDIQAELLLAGLSLQPRVNQGSLNDEFSELDVKAAPLERALQLLGRQMEIVARSAGSKLGAEFEATLLPLYRGAAQAAAAFDAAIVDLKTVYERAKDAGYFMQPNPFAGGRFDSREVGGFFARLLDELHERGFMSPTG
jgi:hypothetical protein